VLAVASNGTLSITGSTAVFVAASTNITVGNNNNRVVVLATNGATVNSNANCLAVGNGIILQNATNSFVVGDSATISSQAVAATNRCVVIGADSVVTRQASAGTGTNNCYTFGRLNVINTSTPAENIMMFGYNNTVNGAITTDNVYIIGRGNEVLNGCNNTILIGSRIQALGAGCTIMCDNSLNVFNTGGINSFQTRFTGGYNFFTNGALTTGVFMAPNDAAWTSISDRSVKKDITAVNHSEIDDLIEQLEVVNFKLIEDESEMRRLGVIANDVNQLFAGKYIDEARAPNGLQAVRSTDISYLTLSALKSLQARVKKLEMGN
jgi:hypothetical protein